jgi:hypothetical protein
MKREDCNPGDAVIARVTLDYPRGYAWGNPDPSAVEIPASIYCVEGDAGIAWAIVKLDDTRDRKRFPADYAHIPLDRLRAAEVAR